MFQAIITPILRRWNTFPPHPDHRQTASPVFYTTSCKHSLVLLRMGEIIARNMLSWLKLLIKLLLLHVVGCLYYYCNPLNAKLNPICHLLALLGAHHILHVSRIRVKCICKFIIDNYRLHSRVFFYHGATTLGAPRTPLYEWSDRRRDLYLTTYNTHKKQTSMLPAGFKPTIPASERPQTHALDRAASGIGS